MPELPEVEIAKQNLQDWWLDRSASRVELNDEKLPTCGTPERLKSMLEKAPNDIRRRGKYLIADFDGNGRIIFHFRMTGKIVRRPDREIDYARLQWRLTKTGEWLAFRDPRRLGCVYVLEAGERLESLERMGPEPDALTPEYLRKVFTDRRLLKTALMDQQLVAGLGNIAISELFWRMGLPPRVKCGELTDQQLEQLPSSITTYLQDVIEAEKSPEIIYVQEDSSENAFDIYRKKGQPCIRCSATIERTEVGGRSSYFCPDCQTK